MVAVFLVQAVAFAVLSAIIASNKNRSTAGWGALGFVFGLFGFIAAIAVSEVKKNTSSSPVGRTQSSNKRRTRSRSKRQRSRTEDFDSDDHEKKCPDCAEYIKLEAQVCKHCGREFSEQEVAEKTQEKREEYKQSKRKKRRRKNRQFKQEISANNCPTCGKKFSGNSQKCSQCGSSL